MLTLHTDSETENQCPFFVWLFRSHVKFSEQKIFTGCDKPPAKILRSILLLGIATASTIPIVRAHDLSDTDVVSHPEEHENSVVEGAIYSGDRLAVSSDDNSSLLLDDAAQELDPPYSGTVFLDPDIFTPDDPTSFIDMEITSDQAENEQYDYIATFSDTPNVELSTFEFSSESLAREVSLKVAKGLGSLPASLKQSVKNILIHQGDGRANANISLGTITLHASSSNFVNYLEELLAHEAAHISLDNRFRRNSDWQYAQTVDPTFISTYAQSRSGTEDIAESVVPYLAYRYRPQRISKADYAAILRTMPARIAFFDRELGNLAPVADDSAQLVSRFTNINNGDNVSTGDFLEWSIPDGAEGFDVILGSTGYGSDDIRQSNILGENRLQLTALPDGIDNVYAKLWSRVDGQWRAVHYRFKTANATRTRASIYSPIPGDRVAGDSVVFRWYNPPGTTQVDLLAGTQGPGSTDLRQSQPLTTRSSLTLDNVPLQPSVLYLRLGTFNGSWQYEDFEFEANQNAQLLSPVAQSRLTETEVEFVWVSPPGVRSIDILAGTTGPGSTDIRASEVVSSDQGQLLVENLPATGQTLYIRFWSLAVDGWRNQDFEYMLPFPQDDRDGDGVNDDIDTYPDDASESADTDGDGVGDNADAFPIDAGETADTDGDGVGDNTDVFPVDASETADADGDGVGDNADAFPVNAGETADTDGDGVGDNADAFPVDAGETADTDTDGDGVGDNADVFPGDASETADSDGDGIGDNADASPTEPDETADGAGVEDNADSTLTDASETSDGEDEGIGNETDSSASSTGQTMEANGGTENPVSPEQNVIEAEPVIRVGSVDFLLLILFALVTTIRCLARRTNPSSGKRI